MKHTIDIYLIFPTINKKLKVEDFIEVLTTLTTVLLTPSPTQHMLIEAGIMMSQKESFIKVYAPSDGVLHIEVNGGGSVEVRLFYTFLTDSNCVQL